MNRKIVYIGLAFLVVAVIVFLVSGNISGSISQSLQSIAITQNLTIQKGGFSFIKMPITNTSTFYLVVANFTRAVNVYLFNSSAFSVWTSALSGNTPASGFKTATSLEGKGAFLIYKDTAVASIPAYIGGSNLTPTYTVSPNMTYRINTYYFVIDNTNGSTSASVPVKSVVRYLPPITNSSLASGNFAGISNAFQEELYLGIAFFVFLVIGIVILVFGLLKKPKDQAEMPVQGWSPAKKGEVNPQYVDKLYGNIGKRRARRPAGKRAKHKR